MRLFDKWFEKKQPAPAAAEPVIFEPTLSEDALCTLFSRDKKAYGEVWRRKDGTYTYSFHKFTYDDYTYTYYWAPWDPNGYAVTIYDTSEKAIRDVEEILSTV